MKKFLLHRIGLTSEPSIERPSLHDCIELVLSQADAVMNDVLEGLAQATVKTKSKSFFGDQSMISREATNGLSAQSNAIKKTFKSQLRLGLYNSVASDCNEDARVSFDGLQLLDSQQIDASIEFALARQEVLRCVDDVLPALSALVSSLLGWVTVQPLLNPLKPEVFVRALQSTLAQHAPDESARAVMVLPAAGLLGVSLRQLYRELSDWLRAEGIEPAAPVGASVGGRGGRAANPESSVGRTLLSLERLRKLLSGEFDDRLGAQDFVQTVPAPLLALEDMRLVETMLRRLTQRASLTADAPRPPAASGRKLGQQLGEEVVRLMIEQLMQDERLLPKVREQIKALEPVLLLLAQSDPRFFSDRQHPARQLLDKLTHRSLGYTSEQDEGFSAFLHSISDAVGVLIRENEPDAPFVRVLRELEKGWADADAVQRQQHEDAARALKHVELRNLLAQSLSRAFEADLKDREVPELVVRFLQGPWAQVVAQSQLGGANGSTDPDAYLALVNDLIWSVQPHLARRNRARLVQLVPDLLLKLRKGLLLIQYPQEKIDDFFEVMIKLHGKVFDSPRQRLEEAAAKDPALELNEVRNAAGLSGFWVADDEARESGYWPEDDEPAIDTARPGWSMRDLNTGVWVELRVDEAWLRAQLTWVSPHRTLFMFVSRGGAAHSMSRRTMERLHLQGRIQHVSDGHVLDHALDAVVQVALQNDLGLSSAKPKSGESSA